MTFSLPVYDICDEELETVMIWDGAGLEYGMVVAEARRLAEFCVCSTLLQLDDSVGPLGCALRAGCWSLPRSCECFDFIPCASSFCVLKGWLGFEGCVPGLCTALGRGTRCHCHVMLMNCGGASAAV